MRRRLMHWLSGLPLLPFAGSLLAQAPGRTATPLRATPEDDLGPFYPLDWGGDIDADLTRLGNAASAAEGRRLQLGGVVRDTRGQPVADAAVEIWQADTRGRYRHPGVDPRTRDAGFQGYGRTMTDADGRYSFLTIMPGNYGSRPPHIHFRVAQPGRAEFVTQMYFRGSNREGNGFAPPEREALTVDLLAADKYPADGALSARFDLVLAAR
jgi:protocatechuate 3,4-dioxygenase beta subunit